MPRAIKVYRGLEFHPSVPFWIQDQPAGPDDVIVGSADLSMIYDFKVYDISALGRPTQVHSETSGNLTLTASPSVGGSGSPLWTLDDVGYTASLAVDPAAWDTPAVAGKSYRLALYYTSIAWARIPLFYEGHAVLEGAVGSGPP